MNGGRSLHDYNRRTFSLDAIVAQCDAMQDVLSTVRQVVDIPTASVLLVGETGTGKDTLAKCLHFSSPRWSQPFVPINCAAIPENLLESELFGHEPGAFTGATGRKQGLLEMATKGTIYLNEIAEMPTTLQVKLLSAVEDRCFYRVGGTELIEYDARIVAATNRNLQDAILDRTFRTDLYYRLNTIRIYLPPLRERREDLTHLAHLFCEEMCDRHRRVPTRQISPDALECLLQHSWPGNIRELRQVIERAVIMSRSQELKPGDFEIETLAVDPGIQIKPDGLISIEFPPDGISLETVERTLIEQALDVAGGVQSRAAKLLHISRDTLRYRMQKYDLADTPTKTQGE